MEWYLIYVDIWGGLITGFLIIISSYLQRVNMFLKLFSFQKSKKLFKIEV